MDFFYKMKNILWEGSNIAEENHDIIAWTETMKDFESWVN